MRFIECKDAHGKNCLIDPLSIQLVEQFKENDEFFLIVYFTNGFQLRLTESYKDMRRKLDDYMNSW